MLYNIRYRGECIKKMSFTVSYFTLVSFLFVFVVIIRDAMRRAQQESEAGSRSKEI